MAFETLRHCPIDGLASTPTPSPCAKQSLFLFSFERLKGYAKPYEGSFPLFILTFKPFRVVQKLDFWSCIPELALDAKAFLRPCVSRGRQQ